jgi:hypothetical protein
MRPERHRHGSTHYDEFVERGEASAPDMASALPFLTLYLSLKMFHHRLSLRGLASSRSAGKSYKEPIDTVQWVGDG